MMFVELYIDSREIPNYNAGKSVWAHDREYGITTTTKVIVPANEVEVVGGQIRIQKVNG